MKLLFTLATSSIVSVALIAVAQPSDTALLKQVDSARFLDADAFVFNLKVVATRPDGTGAAQLRIYNKKFAEGVRQRVEFTAPENMKGTVYLVVGEDIYFWQPTLLKPIKIGGQQKLFGDASVAEAAGISFADRYDIVERQSEKLDGTDTLRLNLKAKGPRTAFQIVTLWVDPQSFNPKHMLLHALSGEPLKKVTYPQYEMLKDDQYAARIVVEELLVKNYQSDMEIVSPSVEPLADSLFDPAQLGKK